MSKKPSPSLAAELKPFVAPFRFDGSFEFHLKSHKTKEKGGIDKDKGEKILESNRKHLSDFQERLYAQDRWSLLLIFQGMDAAGKDSAIKSIFDGVNPQGCEVTPFKQPSTHELDHDFMWRSAVALRVSGRSLGVGAARGGVRGGGAGWAGRSLGQVCRRGGQWCGRGRGRGQRTGRRLGEFDRAAAAERAGPGRPQCRGRAGKPRTSAGKVTERRLANY